MAWKKSTILWHLTAHFCNSVALDSTKCFFIIIFQKADDREKRQEAHRFHFDAMWHALIFMKELLLICLIEIKLN